MDANKQMLTLTKSPNNHFYGYSKKIVEGIMNKGRIPICKMTLSAYRSNIKKMKQLLNLYIPKSLLE